jgi:hypothetical protein
MIFTSTEIHVRAVGSYLVIYLTYMLIEQLEL